MEPLLSRKKGSAAAYICHPITNKMSGNAKKLLAFLHKFFFGRKAEGN